MLNELLTIDRPLFVLDIEATSLDVQTARIVEIAFQRWEATGMTKEWQTRVYPGIPIPASASKIHGIKDADVVDKPTFKQLAANLAKGFINCDWLGQNCRYDLQVMAAEMQRADQPWNYDGARILDAYQLERLAVPRNLSALYEKYMGTKHESAHGALSDVRAAAAVVMKQLEAYPNLPRELDRIHELQFPGEIDAGGKFRMVDGVATCQFGKYRGKPMRDVPASYWDWICSSDFSADVKRLAEDAKLGKFPEAR